MDIIFGVQLLYSVPLCQMTQKASGRGVTIYLILYVTVEWTLNVSRVIVMKINVRKAVVT